MKIEIINGKAWDVHADVIEGDILIVAESGDSVFADWVDTEWCRLIRTDHAECENLSEEDEEALREKFDLDLRALALAAGYDVGASDLIAYGYDGTLEDASEDKELANRIIAFFDGEGA